VCVCVSLLLMHFHTIGLIPTKSRIMIEDLHKKVVIIIIIIIITIIER
jgi:hypothetical protein